MTHMGSLLSVGGDWSLEAFGDWHQEPDLRVTTIHDPPYLSIHPQPNGSYRYEGYLFDVWDTIARQLDLRYRIVPLLEGGGYGNLNGNGTWTGMMGELVYGRADLALTMLYMSPDRAAVVDYIDAVSVGQTGYTFLVRTGHQQTVPLDTLRSLLRPLHQDVWWTLLGSLLLLSLAFRVFSPGSQSGDDALRPTRRPSWGSCVFSTFSLLVGQGWSATPSTASARTATIFSWALNIIIYNSYAATLISHLTVATAPSRPLHSLREFHEAAGWLFAVDPSLGAMNQWKDSQDPDERELYQRSVTGEGFIALNLTRGSQRQVLQPRVMSYADRRKLSYFIGADVCDFVPLLDGPVQTYNNYMVMAKGRHRLRQAINQELRKLKETGVLIRLEQRWFDFSRKCDSSSASGYKELSARELLALLLIIPLATVISVLLAALEWLWFHFSPTKQTFTGLLSCIRCWRTGPNSERHSRESRYTYVK